MVVAVQTLFFLTCHFRRLPSSSSVPTQTETDRQTHLVHARSSYWSTGAPFSSSSCILFSSVSTTLPATRVYSCKTLFFFSSVTRNVCQCHSLARSPAKKEIKKRKGNDFASPFSFYCKSAASTAFLLRLWRFGTRKYHGIISNPTRHLFILVSQRRFLLFIIGLLSVDLFIYSVCLYYSSHHIVLVPSSLFLVHIL